MFKLATATVLCSVGLALSADVAQAGCCRRTSSCCCNPAPSCCAPAPTCAAPTPATDIPAPDCAPPAPPSASTWPGDPSLAMSPDANGRQTYRSFSYDPVPAGSGSYYVPAQPTIRVRVPDRLLWRADRKLLRNY